MAGLKVGVVSRSFNGWEARKTAEFMRENGFASTELCFTHTEANFWSYNGWSDMSSFSDGDCDKVASAFRDNGIYIASLGAFSSLLEPDEDKIAKNIALYKRYIDLAAHCAIPAVATECGFIPGKRGVNSDVYETAFDYFKKNLATVLEYAEKKGVDIALETCVLDVVPSAKRARDLAQQLGSDRLKFLLDPANLIANSSEEDMFKYLAPRVSYFHGKDRHVNDTYGRVVGDGDIDWVRFLTLYHEKCEGVPFILEYVNPENCVEIKNRALAFDAQVK